MTQGLADLSGKTCVVTGGSTGIGREISLGLAQAGARVVVVCRNRERGEAARARIEAEAGPGSAELHLAGQVAL